MSLSLNKQSDFTYEHGRLQFPSRENHSYRGFCDKSTTTTGTTEAKRKQSQVTKA